MPHQQNHQEIIESVNNAGAAGEPSRQDGPSRVTDAQLEGVTIGNRTIFEQKTLKEKISFVARVFSNSYDLEVIPSGGGWAVTVDEKTIRAVNEYLQGERATLDDLPREAFRARTLMYDENDILTKDEDECLGVTRHEVGHVLHSDFKLFFEGQRLAEIGGYMPTTWANLHNALEDVWINLKECESSEVVKHQMGKLYASHTPELLERINTQPLIRQLGLNIIHYWLHGENIPTLKNKEVLKTFEKIEPHVLSYFWGGSPQENFDNLRDNIWPLCRHLEERSAEEEALRQLGKQLSGKNGGSGQEQSQKQGDKGAVSRMIERIRKGLGIKNKQENEEENLKKDLDKALKGKIDPETLEKLKREVEKQAEKQRGDQNSQDPEIDLDDLSEDVRGALEKAARELPKDVRDKLKKKAQDEVDRKQAEALDRDGPKHMETRKDEKSGKRKQVFKKPPSEKQIKSARKEVAKEQEREQAAEDAKAEAAGENDQTPSEKKKSKLEKEMAERGFEKDQADLYRQFRQLEDSVAPQTNSLIKKLAESIPFWEERIFQGEYYNGSKLNRKALSRRLPIDDARIYQRAEQVAGDQARIFVELLIDNSGSMMGEKMEAARMAAIALSRMSKHFGMPISIKLFASDTSTVMNFGEDYDDPKHHIKPKLIEMTDAQGGSTDIGTPLKEAREEMVAGRRRYPGSIGAVFVISDSGANQGITGLPLKKLIGEMQKEFVIVNFILSEHESDIDTSNFYFGENNVIAPKRFEELPQAAGKVLGSILERFIKRYCEEN